MSEVSNLRRNGTQVEEFANGLSIEQMNSCENDSQSRAHHNRTLGIRPMCAQVVDEERLHNALERRVLQISNQAKHSSLASLTFARSRRKHRLLSTLAVIEEGADDVGRNGSHKVQHVVQMLLDQNATRVGRALQSRTDRVEEEVVDLSSHVVVAGEAGQVGEQLHAQVALLTLDVLLCSLRKCLEGA